MILYHLVHLKKRSMRELFMAILDIINQVNNYFEFYIRKVVLSKYLNNYLSQTLVVLYLSFVAACTIAIDWVVSFLSLVCCISFCSFCDGRLFLLIPTSFDLCLGVVSLK